MLSAFPHLLSLWMYVPAILRLTTGIYFFSFGYHGITKRLEEKINIFESIKIRPAKFFAYTLCIVEILGGILLLIGLFVQISAIVFAVISFVAMIIKIRDPFILRRNKDTYILLFVISVSLLFLGPGYYAFDYPL